MQKKKPLVLKNQSHDGCPELCVLRDGQKEKKKMKKKKKKKEKSE